ncbi:MAG: hypothetical protein ACI8WB_005162 [Phenylobacterium sp.]
MFDLIGISVYEYTTVTIEGVEPAVELSNDITVNAAGPKWDARHFSMQVPENAGNLSFTMNGGTGGTNLYVRYGDRPSNTEYDCRPYLGGNDEVCAIGDVQAGTYYVMVRAGDDPYQTTITGSYVENAGAGNAVPDMCFTQTPVTSAQLQPGVATCLGTAEKLSLYIGDVKSHSSIAITTAHGTGDLSVGYTAGNWPNGSTDDGFSDELGNNECIYLTATTDEHWGYLHVWGDASGASIVIDFDTEGCRQHPVVANIPPVPNTNGPYTAQANSIIDFSADGSTDADGSIVSYNWYFADGRSLDEANPQHSYAEEGVYNARLMVTDDSGESVYEYTTVTIEGVEPAVELSNDITVNAAGPQWDARHFSMQVPENAGNLSFTMNGGTGGTNLYVRYGDRASKTEYDCRPYIGGNDEVCAIADAQVGTYYVMVQGDDELYQTTITGSYIENGSAANGVPDMCASQAPVSGGRLQPGIATCIDAGSRLSMYVGDVKSHSSIAITTAHGVGDLSVQYKSGGWPSSSGDDGSSNNVGNSECIYVDLATTEHWGYLHVHDVGVGASIVVDFDTEGCR